MNQDKKDYMDDSQWIEAGAGVFSGVFILTMVVVFVVILFGVSPVIHYLEKWNNYWNEDSSVDSHKLEQFHYNLKQVKANEDCIAKFIEKYKNTSDKYWAFASSTSARDKDGFDTFNTYDCYGSKYELYK